ncbi:MAG: hypothetical protein R2867_32640 [Caldilineaceae bacterium]
MRKRPFSVEWHVAESEEEWAALRAQSAADATAARPVWVRRWRGTAVLLLIAALGLWVWQRQEPLPAGGEDQLALEPVGTMADAIPTSVATATRVPLPDSHELFTSDVVRMLERPEWGIHAYQDTTGPLREILTGGLWGAPRETETTFFHLYYRQRDAQTVAAAASRLDGLYTDLLHNWGLPIPAKGTKVVVQVSEQYILQDGPYQPRRVDPITVSSPALYPSFPA